MMLAIYFQKFQSKNHVGIHYASFASFLKVYKFFEKLKNKKMLKFLLKHILLVEKYIWD